MALWRERAARNEALFREVNEKILDLDERQGGGTAGAFICECADETCVERLPVPIATYTAVRGEGRRFVVAPGHEDLDLETVIERYERFLVIEKFGASGRIAESTDPRGD